MNGCYTSENPLKYLMLVVIFFFRRIKYLTIKNRTKKNYFNFELAEGLNRWGTLKRDARITSLTVTDFYQFLPIFLILRRPINTTTIKQEI